jgi:hypothetical protein
MFFTPKKYSKLSIVGTIFLIQFYAYPQMIYLVLPNTQANPQQNQKSHFCQRTMKNSPYNLVVLHL